MIGKPNGELGPESNLFDSQSSDFQLQELYSIYLCYFDEARGHICLFCFPDAACERTPTHAIDYHPIWFIDAEGRKEHSETLDFEYRLKAGSPGLRHHFFPIQGPGLNQVELEFRGSVYLAAKFSGASFRKKKRAGFTEETPETYVLIVEVPSALRFLGTEILSKLYEELMTKYTNELYLLIEREYLIPKPIKTEEDLKIIELSTELECNLVELHRSTLSRISLDILQGKLKDQLNKQEQMTTSLIVDLIKAGILVERRVELISDSPEPHYPVRMVRRPTKVGGKSNALQMMSVRRLDNEGALEITVRNNSESCLRNVDAKLLYETELFEIQSSGSFVSFWPSEEEMCFRCERVPNDENGAYVFHLDDPEEKLLIRTIKISELEQNPS